MSLHLKGFCIGENAFMKYLCTRNIKRDSNTVLGRSKTSIENPSLIHDFKEITKMRLAISVVFSSLAGYLLVVEVVNMKTLILLALGGYFMVGA